MESTFWNLADLYPNKFVHVCMLMYVQLVQLYLVVVNKQCDTLENSKKLKTSDKVEGTSFVNLLTPDILYGNHCYKRHRS